MSNTEHPLRHVAIKVLEDWAMMLVDPADRSTAAFKLDQPIYVSSVKVSGVFHGTIFILAQRDFIRILADNLVGENPEAELGEELDVDAFREMGNVLVGNFLTAAYGDDVVFEILNPEVTQLTQDKCAEFSNNGGTQFFMADDNPVWVSFKVHEQV